MQPICLFCKSYSADLERAAALVESTRQFNREALRLVLSVPAKDLNAFKARIGTEGVEWLGDEEIVAHTSPDWAKRLAEMPGGLTQQVVKSEFWRLGVAQNYLCLDSDCLFIRPFGASDFIASDGHPYSVLHEGKPWRQFCLTHGLGWAIRADEAEKSRARELFGRSGPIYQFGPLPVIWSAKVWKALADNYLAPKGWSLFDAIQAHPVEATWYGEALLAYGAIPIHPREPLFRAYLYLEDYEHDRRLGITPDIVVRDYLGVVLQSNWYPKRLRPLKSLAYKLKKVLRVMRKQHR